MCTNNSSFKIVSGSGSSSRLYGFSLPLPTNKVLSFLRKTNAKKIKHNRCSLDGLKTFLRSLPATKLQSRYDDSFLKYVAKESHFLTTSNNQKSHFPSYGKQKTFWMATFDQRVNNYNILQNEQNLLSVKTLEDSSGSST